LWQRPTFRNGGWDIRDSKEWIEAEKPTVVDATKNIEDLIHLTYELQGEVSDLSTPSAQVQCTARAVLTPSGYLFQLIALKRERLEECERLKSEIYQLTTTIADNKENVTNSMRNAREEMAGNADSEIQVVLHKRLVRKSSSQ
jgi:hypothetical protein